MEELQSKIHNITWQLHITISSILKPTCETGKNLPVNNTVQSKHSWMLMLLYIKTYTTAGSTVITVIPIYSELQSIHLSSMHCNYC